MIGTPPLFSLSNFGIRVFLKFKSVLLSKISVKWDEKKYERRLVIGATLSYPKHFSVPEFFWNTEGYLYDMFWYSEAKQIRRRVVILPTPFYPKSLSKPDSFWNTDIFPLQCFPVLWDNNFSTKSLDSLPLLSILFSKTRFSPKRRRFPYKVFWCCETINIRQKVVILSRVFSIIFSDTKKIVKHWRFALRKVSVQWVKTISTENQDTLPPISSVKSSDTRNFLLILRTVPLRSFSVLWDKTISAENRDIPHI